MWRLDKVEEWKVNRRLKKTRIKLKWKTEFQSTAAWTTKKEEGRIETLELENISTEMLIQEKYESASENSEDRKVNDSDRKINECVVVQNQECGGKKIA